MRWIASPSSVCPANGHQAIHPDDLAPPAWRKLHEMAWHLPRVLAGLGALGPRGPEDGPPVLVIPGFLATDRTTMELRRALARAGWRSHPWLLGLNRGARADTMEVLERRLDEVRGNDKALLVGWSLGGMFARQLAHRCPHKVRGVVTLGSPFSGNLKTNTNVCELYEWIAGHDVNDPPFACFADKPPVPTLAMWSRRDGIVAPSAARGRAHERDKAVEIDAHHAGFAVYRPVVSQIVAEIATFLGAFEGRPPELRPAAAAVHALPLRRAAV